MSKKTKANARAEERARIAKARQLVYDAIGEICQSKKAIYLSKELSQLRNIEDVLWQFATAMKGE